MKYTIIVLVVVGLILGILISYTTAVEIRKTEGGDFCAKCHTMKLMTQAHNRSPHGGNNKFGISAQCVDCHLPHDTLAHYMISKIHFGVRDLYLEFFTDTSDINWTKKREYAKEFVFNSGCLSCHSQLNHSLMENIDPKVVEKADNHTLKTSCIECHPNVGHRWDKSLNKELMRE